MRMLTLALAGVLLAAPAVGTADPKPRPVVADTPCALGGALLREVAATEGSRGVIYDATPFQPIQLRRSARDPAPPPGVPADLAARWNAAGRSNLLAACPAVAAALPSGVRLATEAEREAVRSAAHGPMLRRISAPVANAAGDHVLIAVGSQCPGLCGSGSVLHYRKTARGWVLEPTLGMWFS